jgi:hypothetical protein
MRHEATSVLLNVSVAWPRPILYAIMTTIARISAGRQHASSLHKNTQHRQLAGTIPPALRRYQFQGRNPVSDLAGSKNVIDAAGSAHGNTTRHDRWRLCRFA